MPSIHVVNVSKRSGETLAPLLREQQRQARMTGRPPRKRTAEDAPPAAGSPALLSRRDRHAHLSMGAFLRRDET